MSGKAGFLLLTSGQIAVRVGLLLCIYRLIYRSNLSLHEHPTHHWRSCAQAMTIVRRRDVVSISKSYAAPDFLNSMPRGMLSLAKHP
jgi:hypothetical protein